MKKIIFALVAVLAFSFTAKAEEDGEAKRVKGYNRVSVMYSRLFSYRTTNGQDAGTKINNGVGVSYARGLGFFRSLPLYFEVGVSGQYYPGTKGMDTKGLEMLRISVPVNVTYRFSIGRDGILKIAPYTGLNFGFNAVNDVEWSYWEMVGGYIDFDRGKVFQLGWLVGANVSYKGFNIGVGYCLDLMSSFYDTYGVDITGRPYAFEIGTNNLQVSVGYEF